MADLVSHAALEPDVPSGTDWERRLPKLSPLTRGYGDEGVRRSSPEQGRSGRTAPVSSTRSCRTLLHVFHRLSATPF